MTQVKQTLGWLCLVLFIGWFILFFVALGHKITPPMPTELNPEQVVLAEKLKADYPKVSTFTADDGRLIYCAGANDCSAEPPSWINPNSGEIRLTENDQWRVAQLSNIETFWGATMQVSEYHRLRNVLVAGMIFSTLLFFAYILPPLDLDGEYARKYSVVRWIVLLLVAMVVGPILYSGVLSIIVLLASIVTGPLLLFLALWGFSTPPTITLESDGVGV